MFSSKKILYNRRVAELPIRHITIISSSQATGCEECLRNELFLKPELHQSHNHRRLAVTVPFKSNAIQYVMTSDRRI